MNIYGFVDSESTNQMTKTAKRPARWPQPGTSIILLPGTDNHTISDSHSSILVFFHYVCLTSAWRQRLKYFTGQATLIQTKR